MENKVLNLDFLKNELPDNCADLIIADPPYFETKGAFDFIWDSFDDYLKDVERWAAECFRILKPNGTLYWWGHAKKIAYSQIILDKFFTLQNSLVWEKSDCQVKKINPDSLRSFAPITERCLMYSFNVIPSQKIFSPIMNYIKEERLKCDWNYSQMDDFLNIKTSSCYWDKETTHQYTIPSEENWKKLQETGCFRKPYEELRGWYEELRGWYEELRRPFDTRGRLLTDVLLYSQETHITKNYNHDTKKPETLTRELILTSSRAGDLVIVPFAGSGTECAMAKKEGRHFIGFDIEPKYVEMSNKRVNNIMVKHPKLQFYETQSNQSTAASR